MTHENSDDQQATRARPKLAELRHILDDARASGDAQRSRAALIEVVEGLISHAEMQAGLMEDVVSDMTHKQGIVTNIGGQRRK